MAFSADVRTRTLIAAARHCCVCHRYKGVKVEVHHVVPQGEGGSDEFENAIPLCFDCHADAGHYNPRHPRGTKFSRDELRAARDTWYSIVERNGVQAPTERDWLYCRYLVCKNFGALLEISRGDFSRFPVPNVLLVRNSVLEFLRASLSAHGKTYRHAREWGDRYQSEREYFGKHPDAVRTDRGETEFPFFETFRVPTSAEVRQRVGPEDRITGLLMDSGVSPDQIACVVGFFEPCSAGSFQEMYRLRPLWGAFLAVTNIAEEPVQLSTMVATAQQPMSVSFRSLEDRVSVSEIEEALPAAPILPGATVIIPVATVLAPLQHVTADEGNSSEQELGSAQWQRLVHLQYEQTTVADFRLVGPSLHPRGMWLGIGGQGRFQEIHELDLSNLYALDRGWDVGSCPHLLFKQGAKKRLRYQGSLFSRNPARSGTEVIEVPVGACELVIAELEREVTYIESVMIDGAVALKDITLRQGEIIRLSVSGGSTVRVVGRYMPHEKAGDDIWQRNVLIAEFLAAAGLGGPSRGTGA